jgi:hypothetical protein
VESPFAALRLRTDAAKRFKKVENATAAIFKLPLVAEKNFSPAQRAGARASGSLDGDVEGCRRLNFVYTPLDKSSLTFCGPQPENETTRSEPRTTARAWDEDPSSRPALQRAQASTDQLSTPPDVCQAACRRRSNFNDGQPHPQSHVVPSSLTRNDEHCFGTSQSSESRSPGSILATK